MKLTNKYNLPEALFNAVKNDTYVRSTDPNHFSCTGLLRPPRQRALEKTHYDEIEEDVSDRIWSLLGQSVHVICERGNVSDIAEKRFSAKFGDSGQYTISAQIDHLGLKDGVLTDYKTTSVYKFKNGKPDDPNWIAQLNIQAELLRQNRHEVKSMQIVALLRDHSKRKASTDFTYPELPVIVVPIEMWPRHKTVEFINERVRLQLEAEKTLPLCSPEDRWATDPVYAVMKKGRKSAVKLFDNEEEASKLVAASSEHYLQRRPGESRRCAEYCSVSKFCKQYQQELQGNED